MDFDSKYWIEEYHLEGRVKGGAIAFMDIVDKLDDVSLEDFKSAQGDNIAIKQLMALTEPTDKELKKMKDNPMGAQRLSYQNMFRDMTKAEYYYFKRHPYTSKHAAFFIKKLSGEYGNRLEIEREWEKKVTARLEQERKKNKQVHSSSNKMPPGAPLVDSDTESDSEEANNQGGSYVEETAVVGDCVVEEALLGCYRKRRRKKKIRKKKKTKKRKRKNTKKKKKKRRRRTKKKRRRRR